ncbi:MAG: hypothetical protein KF832_24520 [Caldilineaceae bacterium]|nr:hypothetical protein [Caldilineaceae bacterium]
MAHASLNIRTRQLPFRVGTTSYIIAADLLPNAQWLADYVQDMQLVLFDLPDGPSNLPSAATVAALAALGRDQDLTYTVHLIEDLTAAPPPILHPSMQKAQAVITQTAALTPWSYVLHLEGRSVRAPATAPATLTAWQQAMSATLQHLADWLGDGRQLAVENLEGYPPTFVEPVVNQTTASRCFDIGHLWLDGYEPLPLLAAALPQTRVIHLHGLHEGRDHQSLAHLSPAQLDPIITLLLRQGYTGVLTLEIFGEADFWSSLEALHASLDRCQRSRANEG